MATIGSLALKLSASSEGLAAGLSKGQRMIQSFAATSERKLGGIGDKSLSGGGIGAGLESALGAVAPVATMAAGAIAAVGAAAAGAVGWGAKLAADQEDLLVSFEVMLKSADAAKSMLADLSQFAAETPFETPEIAKAAKQLLSFGVAGDKVIDTLGVLGDVASGVGAPIGDLAGLLGKVKATGRLTGEVLQSFADRGVNLRAVLGKQFGKTAAEVEQMVSRSQVSFNDFAKALESLTSAGGTFENMMGRRSQTINGLISTLSDNTKMALTEIGDIFNNAIDVKHFIAELTKIPEWLKDHAQDFKPFFDGIGEGLHALWDVVRATSDVLQPVFEDLGRFAQELSRSFGDFGSTRDMVITGLEAIASSLAYVWDTVRMGAGLIHTYFEVPFEAALLGTMNGLADLFRMLSRLPDEFGGGTFKGLDQSTRDMLRLRAIAAKASDDVYKKLSAGQFGDTARMMDEIFAKVRNGASKSSEATVSLAKRLRSITDAGAGGELQLIGSRMAELAKETHGSTGALADFHGRLSEVLQMAATAKGTSFLPGLAVGSVSEGQVALAEMVRRRDALQKQIAESKPPATKGFEGGAFMFLPKMKRDLADMNSIIELSQKALGTVAKLQAARDEALSGKRMQAIAAAVTPLQKFQAEMDDLTELFRDGGISAAVYGVNVAKAVEGISSSFATGESVMDRYRGGLMALQETAKRMGSGDLIKVPAEGFLDLGADAAKFEAMRRQALALKGLGQDLLDGFRTDDGSNPLTGMVESLKSAQRETAALIDLSRDVQLKFGADADIGPVKRRIEELDRIRAGMAADLTFTGTERLVENLADLDRQQAELQKMVGTFEAMRAAVAGLNATVRSTDLLKLAADVKKSVESPIVALEKKWQELHTLFLSDLIDDDTFALAAEKIRDDILKLTDDARGLQDALGLKLPPALLEGSAEAVSAVNRFRLEAATPPGAKQQRDTVEADRRREQELMERSNRLLESIDERLRKADVIKVR